MVRFVAFFLAFLAFAPAAIQAAVENTPLLLPTFAVGLPGDELGRSIDIAGPYAVSGASQSLSGPGEMWIWDQDSSGDWSRLGNITRDGASVGDNFAWDVSASGDLVVIGIPTDDVGGVNAGAVAVWELSGSIGSAYPVQSDDVDEGDFFGNAVDLDGERMIVGAPNEGFLPGDNYGAAYILERQSPGVWIQTAKLQGQGLSPNLKRAERVALSGNNAMFSAPREAIAGAVYLYTYTEGSQMWTLTQRVTPESIAISPTFGNPYFGWDFDISGDVFAVSSFYESSEEVHAGAVFVWHYDTEDQEWKEGETHKIQHPDPEEDAYFGSALALDGDTLLIGAEGEQSSEDNSVSSGAAFKYIYNSKDQEWVLWQRYEPAVPLADGKFGTRVAQHQGISMIGSADYFGGGSRSGSVWMARCGDGIVNDEEECDDAALDDSGECLPDCRVPRVLFIPRNLFWVIIGSIAATTVFAAGTALYCIQPGRPMSERWERKKQAWRDSKSTVPMFETPEEPAPAPPPRKNRPGGAGGSKGSKRSKGSRRRQMPGGGAGGQKQGPGGVKTTPMSQFVGSDVTSIPTLDSEMAPNLQIYQS